MRGICRELKIQTFKLRNNCGNKLEESQLQRNKDILSQEEQEKEQIKAQLKNVLKILDQTGLDLDVEDMI